MLNKSKSEEGVVLELLDSQARIKIPKSASCQGCCHKGVCDPFGREHMVVVADNSLKAKIGQKVRVGFYSETQLKAILILYMLPLLVLFVGAVIGNYWDPFQNKDLSAALFGLGGVVLTYVGIRSYSIRRTVTEADYQPRIEEILN